MLGILNKGFAMEKSELQEVLEDFNLNYRTKFAGLGFMERGTVEKLNNLIKYIELNSLNQIEFSEKECSKLHRDAIISLTKDFIRYTYKISGVAGILKLIFFIFINPAEYYKIAKLIFKKC